jgi:TRAP-type C4-dicarboxylate transport system permease small subunit
VSVASFRRGFELSLEWIVMLLMAVLAVVVTAGVAFRYTGYSLVWYDEVACVLLAWVTFYGSALAVMKHGHMGVPEIVRMMPPVARVVVTVVAQVATIAFFVLLAWTGYSILEILKSDTMVSLPAVSIAVPNSVIPISAVLIIIAQLLVFPEVLREARRGDVAKAEELI